MKKKERNIERGKSIIIFMICFGVLILVILYINWKMDDFMPNAEGTVEIYDIPDRKVKSNLSVMSRISMHISGGAGVTPKKETNNKYAKEIQKYCGENTTMLCYRIFTEEYGEMEYDSFIDTNNRRSILLYLPNENRIYYSKYYYTTSVQILEEDQEVVSAAKEELVKEVRNKIKEIEIEEIQDFEPESVWRLSDSFYSLRDSERNITVNYDFGNKELIGFMVE